MMNQYLFIIFVSLIVIGAIVGLKYMAWRFVYLEDPKMNREKFEEMQARDSVQLHESCGGIIGRMKFSFGLLTVTVNDKAILLNPIFVGKGFIYFHEVEKISYKKWGLVRGIDIIHHSPRVRSRVFLFTGFDEELKNVILSNTVF